MEENQYGVCGMGRREDKKTKYLEAVQTRRATFTPFVVSVDGVLGREANVLIKRLAEQIAFKWEKSLSEVMGWVWTSDGLGLDQ